MAKHWRPITLAISVLIWEFAVNLALQKGFLDAVPNLACFLLLAVPVVIFVFLALMHPEARKRYHMLRGNKRMTFLIFTFGGAVLGAVLWCFFFITHPAPPQKEQISTQVPLSDSADKVKLAHRQALKSKSQNLSTQIFSFLDEWRKNKPQKVNAKLAEQWRTNDQAFLKTWMEDGDISRKYDEEMTDRFAQQFAPRASAIGEEMAQIGLTSTELNKVLKARLRFPWEIRTVAEELQKLSNKIEE